MFKSVRWRTDKHNNKITALFKLRFHATQVSHLGGNALVLTLVPADTGKPTAKLEKCEIRDDCCYWENPIFESVKFIQDPKTGKIRDRIYHCTISMGSSKSTVLGEASVNIAEYAGAVKAVSVSLLLKDSNSDVTLHVLIQRIQENVNQREIEEHEGAKIELENKCLKKNISDGDTEEKSNRDATNEEHLEKTVSNIAELHDNRSSSIGSDITLSSTDGSSGLYTPRELGVDCSNTLMDSDSITHKLQGTKWELIEVPDHDPSTDDSTNIPFDSFPSGRSQFASDHSTENLKTYIILLSKKAEMSDLELQTLRKQIVKERKRCQDLLKQVACLKVDRHALVDECDKLKASQKGKDESKTINKLSFDGDLWTLLEETRQELTHVKDLNVSLQLQLEKTEVSNLEERCLQGHDRSDDEEQLALEEIIKQHSDAKETYILEQRVMDLCSEIEMYRRDKDELEMKMEQLALDYEILKQENHDMFHKLDQSHMQEQLKLQYQFSGSYHTANELENQLNELQREIKQQSNGLTDSLSSIKWLENHVHSPEHELEKQAHVEKDKLEVVSHICEEESQILDKLEIENQKAKEHSNALATIKELEDQIQSLGEELDKQALGFESDLEALTHAKIEQEQRAIQAEEELRLTRWKNATTAGRIQDEFKRLYMQITSAFKANEEVALKAMTEASELRLINNHLQELLQQATEELQSVKSDYEEQINDLNNKLTLKSSQIEEMLNQLNHQIQQEDEICQCLSAELLIRRSEADRLTSDTGSVGAKIEQGGDWKEELEQLKTLVKEQELLAWMEKLGRKNLAFSVDSVNEKDTSFLNLQSEVNTVKSHCEELRHSLYWDKIEKDRLRKEVILLEAELKKDDALTNMERKLHDSDAHAELAERRNTGYEECTVEVPNCVSVNATSLREKIIVLEGLIKQKENALETSACAFGEKEKDLHNKIEELEKRFKDLNNCCATYSESERRKVDGKYDGFDLNDDSYTRVDSMIETSAYSVKENGAHLSTLTINSRDEYGVYNLLNEMACLRERNSSMELELKEMQHRYSEMSVNFSEVEGERQMLVMTLRSMKNDGKI